MSNPAFDLRNVSVLEPIPVTSMRAEIDKFKHLPPYLYVGQAATLMGLTEQGARALHDRCEPIGADRNEFGHRIFRRDACVAYRWFHLTFGSPQNDDNASPEGWHI